MVLIVLFPMAYQEEAGLGMTQRFADY